MKIPREILGDVGRCIYCNKSDQRLSDEHIVPFGLNGPWVLLNATCEKCASITSKIERDVLRNSLIVARTSLNFPTRRKNQRPKKFPLVIIKNGTTQTIQVPKDQYFSTLLLPVYELPGHLTGSHYEKGIVVKGINAIQISGPPIKKIAEKYDTKEISVSVNWRGNLFERMLAKIGLGFAIAKYGIDAFEQIYVRPSILGEKEDVGQWVGTAEDYIMDVGKSLHQIQLFIYNYDIIARIKLFSFFDNVPEYLVVVGHLNKEIGRF